MPEGLHLRESDPKKWEGMTRGEQLSYDLGRMDATLRAAEHYRGIPIPSSEASRWLEWERDPDQHGSQAAISRGAIEHVNRLLPVVAVAEKLVQDALGDEHLWAVLTPLRAALAEAQGESQ